MGDNGKTTRAMTMTINDWRGISDLYGADVDQIKQREIFLLFSKRSSVCNLKLFWGVAGQTHRLVQSAVTVADIWKSATKMYRGSSLLILGLYMGIYGCSGCSNVNSAICCKSQTKTPPRQTKMIFVVHWLLDSLAISWTQSTEVH